MLSRVRQLAVVWLGALGFFVQSLLAGIPAGHTLCIGCEHGGWTISAPCADDDSPNCCDESDGTSPADPTLPVASERNECGCIDVPLMGGAASTASAPRAESPTGGAFKMVPVVALVPFAMTVESRCTAVCPRAGPRSPSRLLAPMSRRTVLVL